MVYRYYIVSTKSAAPSRQSPAVSPTPSGLDDFYCGYVDEDPEVGADYGGVATSARWEVLSNLRRYCHGRIERDRIEFSNSLNDLLEWLNTSAPTGAPLFGTPSRGTDTADITTLRSFVTLFEQQLQASEEKQNVQELNLLGRLSAAEERDWNGSVSNEALLKQQSPLKQ